MAEQPAAHHDVDLQPVPSKVIATWPVGHFLENIAILPDDDFVVAVHNRRELHRVGRDGTHRLFASLPVSPAGLIAAEDGVFLVGGEPGEGPHQLLHVDLHGQVEKSIAIPDTLFLNGFTPAMRGRAFAVDSLKGVVIEIDLQTGSSTVVLHDERLAKVSAEPMLPGANGLKTGKGALYITNTDRALVLRAPLDSSGKLEGSLEVIAENLRGDDLALDVDGTLYITNHIHNTLIRLRQNGERIAIAGPAQGMAGSTACIFGIGEEDRACLYVTTTGGIVMPLDGVVQEAKLVRLDVGVAGRPIAFL